MSSRTSLTWDRLGSPADFVLDLNLTRRHLTREQRAELHRKLCAQGLSVRQIAKTQASVDIVHSDLAGVQNRTPAPEAARPARVRGTDGRFYPASKPMKVKKPAPAGPRPVDPVLTDLCDAKKIVKLLPADDRLRAGMRRASSTPPN